MASRSQRIYRVPTPAERGAAIFDAYRYQFTQAGLAALLGVSQNTISRWSTGVSEPTLETFIRIESACGLAQGHILRSAGYVEELGAAEDFIAADHRLDDVRRNLLLSLYLVALHQAIVDTAQAWETAAREAVAVGVTLSWPPELTDLTDELMRTLSRQPAAAQRFTAQRSSLDVVAAINNLGEIAEETSSLSLLLRAQLGLGPAESC